MNYQRLLNIAIIIGGKSVEHEISLISGLQAILNLDKNKYNIHVLYLTKDNNLVTNKNLTNINTYKNQKYPKKTNCCLYKQNNKTILKTKYKKTTIDCIIPIVHGNKIEDGTLSGYLELLGTPYTSSNILSSAIAQDKVITKRILKSYNLKVLPSIDITQSVNLNKIDKFIQKHNFPLILKPATLGSSIGIKIASTKEELLYNLKECMQYANKVLIEPKLQNFTEYNCAAYKSGSRLILSQIEEVTTSNEILTFNDKYEDGGLKQTDKSTRIIPAKIPLELEEEIYNTTKQIYENLNFKGVIRIDYIYDLNINKLYINEINTIPGSLAFYLFEGLGIKYQTLLDDLIKQAIIEHNKEEQLINSFENNILNLDKLKPKK